MNSPNDVFVFSNRLKAKKNNSYTKKGNGLNVNVISNDSNNVLASNYMTITSKSITCAPTLGLPA